MGWFSKDDSHGSKAKPACGDNRAGKGRAATRGPWADTEKYNPGTFGSTFVRQRGGLLSEQSADDD